MSRRGTALRRRSDGAGRAQCGNGCPHTRSGGRRSQLIDYAMRQIPAQDIRAAGRAGVVNYVSNASSEDVNHLTPESSGQAFTQVADGLCRWRAGG
jgi:hypothetical protein